MDHTNLLEHVKIFHDKSRPKTKKGKNRKGNTFNGGSALYEGRELTLNAFRGGLFPIKDKQ